MQQLKAISWINMPEAQVENAAWNQAVGANAATTTIQNSHICPKNEFSHLFSLA